MSIVPEAAPGGHHEHDRSTPGWFVLYPAINEARIAKGLAAMALSAGWKGEVCDA